MAARTNKDKGVKNEVLEEIENEDAPNNSETPQLILTEVLKKDPNEVTAEEMDFIADNKDDLSEEQKVQFGLIDAETVPEVEEEEEDTPETPPVTPTTPVPPVTLEESDEDKEKKYRAQQSEAQVQAEKNKQLVTKIAEAADLPEPTQDELTAWLRQDGVDIEELTDFEKAMAKKNFVSERKLAVINDAAQASQKIDEWAGEVDTFIDGTDGKPEFLPLSGHEADFRRYAMQAAHRGVSLEVLLPAFLHSLPPTATKRGNLFNRGGGGERPAPIKTDVITDAQEASNLRMTNPREYARRVKAGKVKLDV